MRIGPMPLHIAIRLAGARRPDNMDDSADYSVLWHCGQLMDNVRDEGQYVRFVCRTCGTDITHIDGHGQPASITPHHRHILEQTDELWTVGQDTMAPLNSRGPGGTSHD